MSRPVVLPADCRRVTVNLTADAIATARTGYGSIVVDNNYVGAPDEYCTQEA